MGKKIKIKHLLGGQADPRHIMMITLIWLTVQSVGEAEQDESGEPDTAAVPTMVS